MTTIEARITEALTEHYATLANFEDDQWECLCGHVFGVTVSDAAHAAHQAAVVAGIVTEAQAEAWDACINNDTPWINPFRKDAQ